MTALLELEGVGLAAGARVLAHGLSLQIRAGEVWAVVGANGAGKTTLLRSAAGFQRLAAGEVRLGGTPVERLAPREAARRRAFLPQSIQDAFPAPVLEVVLLGLHPTQGRWSWEDRAQVARAHQALAAVDAAHLARRDVATLSGGERQQVAIAALLLQDAPLLLLDEPVAHLDMHHQVAVLARLAGLAREGRSGVVFSVHDVNLAARFATHAVLFRGGGRVDHGPAAAILEAGAIGEAFGHRVLGLEVEGRTLFVAS